MTLTSYACSRSRSKKQLCYFGEVSAGQVSGRWLRPARAPSGIQGRGGELNGPNVSGWAPGSAAGPRIGRGVLPSRSSIPRDALDLAPANCEKMARSLSPVLGIAKARSKRYSQLASYRPKMVQLAVLFTG
jgi:hypothetical protein